MIDDSTIADALSAGDDEATTLVALLASHYHGRHADDAFDFADADPLSLEHELRREFGAAGSRALVKIHAALALLMRPQLFTSSLGFFTAICSGLAGGVTGPSYSPGSRMQTMRMPDTDDILWAVTEAGLLLGDRLGDDYSPQIRRWVGMTLADEGYRMAPEMLSWADYGRADENRALRRSSDDRALGTAISRLALEHADALELCLATRLGSMLERWQSLGLAREGDAWFDSLAEGVTQELDRISSKRTPESTD